MQTQTATQANQPRRSTTVDSHLVMNVLNQLAAQDYTERGEENPLLFALSDYLRDALVLLDNAQVNVAQEARAMAAHATLVAQVHGAEISFSSSTAGVGALDVPTGTLAAIAGAMLKVAKPLAGASWHLRLTSPERPDPSGPVVAVIELAGQSPGCEMDLASARVHVGKLNLRQAHDGSPISIQLEQQTRSQLRAICQLPPKP